MEENETGIVRELSNNRILVECDAVSMCSSCSEKSGCTMSSEGKTRHIWMNNTLGAKTGDVVMFKIEKKGVVFASLVLYLLPVIFLFSGMWAGYKIHSYVKIDTDLCSIIGGMAGLILSYVFIKVFSVITSKKDIFHPVLVKIIKNF